MTRLGTKLFAASVMTALVTSSLSLAPVNVLAAPPATHATALSPQLQEQLAYFDTSSSEPVRVIVQLSLEPASVYGAAFKNRGQAVAAAARQEQLGKVRAERGNAIRGLLQRNLPGPQREYEEVFNGFALTLPANQLPALAAMTGVVGIYPDAEVVRTDTAGDDDALVPVEAPELDSSVPAVKAPTAWSQGYTGKGILVAILDDGVDYTHPDLGGCLGAGCKVVDGYDFVDLDADPQEGWTDGARDYHGTHVAATAAGLKGVAPGANVLAVRVLGANSTGKPNNLSAVMAGLDYAVARGADVANMSLGIKGTFAPSYNLWGQMVSNAIKTGMVLTNSNGNDGPGYYTTGVYASSPDTIGVGNSDARTLPYPRTVVAATGEALRGGSYGAVFPEALLGVQLDVVDVGYGNSPTDYAGKNLAGKIAIAQRGGPGDAAFINKGLQAQAAGAAGIIIYNDAARATDFSTAELAVPSFTMSYANGLKVIANPQITVENFAAGAQMNSSSSRGPTPDLMIKPDVTAPGTAIIAAVPFNSSPTGYAALNGTSMAAPHAAGAVAILRQARPEWNPQQIKLALMNTGSNMVDLAGADYRVVDQGAGFIDIERALAPKLSINPGSLSFGQLMPAAGYTQTRSVSVSAYQPGARYQITTRLLKAYPGVSVTTSTSLVDTNAGAATFSVTASLTPGVTPAGEYEGYVYVTNVSDPADSYRIPFLFVHQVPVSELKISSGFLGAGQSMDVTFNVGRPLSNWYLGTMAGTRFTNNLGAINPGSYTYKWNGRTNTGANLAEGSWNIGLWYQLPGSTTWTFSQTYARFFVDRTAPAIALDAQLPALTSQAEIDVAGAVADSGMYTYGDVGGKVLVNGVAADLAYRSPALRFPAQNSEMSFTAKVALNEGANTITLVAQDSAGNKSATQSFTVVRDSSAPVTTAVLSPAPNAAGWNNSDVTVTLTAADTSGVATLRHSVNGGAVTEAGATAQVVIGTEGTHTVTYHAVDALGNAEAPRSITINLDKSGPVVAFTGDTAYTVDQTVSIGCTAADSLSGLAANGCVSVSAPAWSLALGTHELTATAADHAGNSTTVTTSYTVSVSYDSLGALSVQFLGKGEPSIATSLTAKLAAAKEAQAKGNTAAAGGQAEAFKREVQALSGKQLTAEQAAVLLNLAGALLQ